MKPHRTLCQMHLLDDPSSWPSRTPVACVMVHIVCCGLWIYQCLLPWRYCVSLNMLSTVANLKTDRLQFLLHNHRGIIKQESFEGLTNKWIKFLFRVVYAGIPFSNYFFFWSWQIEVFPRCLHPKELHSLVLFFFLDFLLTLTVWDYIFFLISS